MPSAWPPALCVVWKISVRFQYDCIPQVPHRPEIIEVAESLILKLKGSGLNAGLVDILITAQAKFLRAAVLSSDRVFDKLAERGLIALA